MFQNLIQVVKFDVSISLFNLCLKPAYVQEQVGAMYWNQGYACKYRLFIPTICEMAELSLEEKSVLK